MNNLVQISPAWSGPHEKREDGPSNARKILVPVSHPERSHEALALALLLARESGGQLVLLHAVELNIVGEERGIGRTRLVQELMSAAEARLIHLARSMCANVPFSVVVSEGPPDVVILWKAQALRADTIVMGPRRPGVFSWLRRDNVRAVLRQTQCAVYIAVATGALVNASTAENCGSGPMAQKAGNLNCVASNRTPSLGTLKQKDSTLIGG
jgi:nucleotide-binding universal stress UspA family protein